MSKNPIRILWVTFGAILGPFAAPPAGAQELLVGQVAALTNPATGDFDLGGVYVNYSPKARRGWGTVDLTVIGPSGKLLR